MKPSSCTLYALVAGAALIHGAALAATATNPVSAVQVKPATESTSVVIKTKVPPQFTLFKLTAPTRVVIDIDNADITAVPSPIAGAGHIEQVTLTQFEDGGAKIGRAVVVLGQAVTYDVQAQGNTVVLTATLESKKTEPTRATNTEQKRVLNQEPSEQKNTATLATKLLAIESRRHKKGSILKLRTNGEPLRYEIKEVENPPRLVVDLYDISSKLRHPQRLKDPNLRKVRVGKHHHKTRIVIDTKAGIPVYGTAVASDGITLAFSNELSQPKPMPEPDAAIADVSYAKKNGFYRLRVKVNGDYQERLASDAPRMKVMEIAASLPKSLGRTLDASKLGGPVRRVSTYVDPDNPKVVRFAADLKGEVEHKMWRQGNELFWDFRASDQQSQTAHSTHQPAKPQAVTTSAAAGFASQATNAVQSVSPAARRYKGRKITLDVKDADILNVLRLLADVSRLNIIAADDVKGKITIKLRNVPWDHALDVILKSKGLDKERSGGIIRVAPIETLNKERELRLKRKELEDRSVPTTVRLLVVNYASAAEMLPQVQKLLSKRGRATVDQRTNVIIVEDIKENLVQAERLVRTLDTQTPQVLIETRIVEASSSFVQDLGIQWGGDLNFSPANGNPTGLVFPYMIGAVGGADDQQSMQRASPGNRTPPNHAVNYPAAAAGPGSSAMGMSFGSVGNAGTLNLRLSAAETDGSAKVISAPRVVTLDNKTAKISQGMDIPIMTVSAAGTQTQLISAALELEVTPHVTTDASVLLKIHVANNTPNFDRVVQGVPALDKKEADTEVLLSDGDTSVIGGIYTRRTAESYRYTPFLGRIPLLGWLFKNSYKEDSRTELLAFITPHIVNRSSALIDESSVE